MAWGVLLALVSAIFSSLKGISRKHAARDFSSVEIGFMGQVYGVILLFPVALWQYLKTGFTVTPGISIAILLSTLVVLTSTYLYIEALRISDISVTEPLRNTSPIFVAILEPIFLSIDFRLIIMGAALFGSVGAYILVAKDSLLTPIENMRNKGALLSLIVAFILAVYSVAQRFGATNANPILFLYASYITILIGFWIWKKKESAGNIQLNSFFRRDVFAVGTTTALGVLAGIIAYSMISASEVTVIKQASAVFGVLIGGRFFKEDSLKRKLIGAIIIMAGVALVASL